MILIISYFLPDAKMLSRAKLLMVLPEKKEELL